MRTDVDVLVVGVPWMRTRKSPLLLGVGQDAEVVVERLAQ
jgi:putative flavoprotein involved in K+ transport